ncbi:MAG: hypothetical protein JRH01_15170 [Deltaproteobacteria bacterium]|nr:hypothetical protein [Deltaproteobacteria bacterium]MBW2392843.1 hypothetical protein [Deltaproteobacteria bacterium]
MQRMRHKKREDEIHEFETSDAQPAESPAAGGSVQVIWGAMVETLDLGEFTVSEAFRMLRAPFNIAPAVNVLVNGTPVDGEHRLNRGDVLEFARPAGEKGAG